MLIYSYYINRNKVLLKINIFEAKLNYFDTRLNCKIYIHIYIYMSLKNIILSMDNASLSCSFATVYVMKWTGKWG
jgi:hypothetical protein